MDSIYCTFEHKLSLSDITSLSRIINAVIPIQTYQHLISNFQLGLHGILSDKTDYVHTRDILRKMFITILEKVEGNQLILKKPIIGKAYTIKNTGPFPWERGDNITLIPPILSIEQTKIMTFGDWNLLLPLLVPVPIATEINIRLLCMGLLSLHRSFEEIQTAIHELRIIQYRDVTISLPDTVNDKSSMVNMKNVCVALSLITALAPDAVQTYIQKLSLNDHSMLLIKCQELLSKRHGNENEYNKISLKDELKKIKAVLTMVDQIYTAISEKPIFLVCDVSSDGKIATCIFKD